MRQWDEIYDKPAIRSVQELQVLIIADDIKVPPHRVREEYSHWEIQQWAAYQKIKQDRDDEAQADAERGS